MTLQHALVDLFSSEDHLGYYVETPITEDSEVRIGRVDYPNGGVLDDKVFIGTLEQLHHSMFNLVGDGSTHTGDEDFEEEWKFAAYMLIDELSINHKQDTMMGCMHCGDPHFEYIDAETRACSTHCAKILKEKSNDH